MGEYQRKRAARQALARTMSPLEKGMILGIGAPKQVKGLFDGNCNRTACQRPIKGDNWWNSSTRAYYCRECAEGHHGINYWSRRDDGITICTAVTDPNDKPSFPRRPGDDA